MRRPFLHPGKAVSYSPTPADVLRFLAKVAIDEGSKFRGSCCWVWQAHTDDNGYGHFWLGGQRHGAHRASYVIFRSGLRGGQDVDHRCTNHACVNPRHLRATSRSINSSRGAKRRAAMVSEPPF